MGRARKRADTALRGVDRLSVSRSAALLPVLGLIASCTAVPPPPVAPVPAPRPAPASPPPAPAPVDNGLSWEVAPVASGGWSYGTDGASTVASFGVDGASPSLRLRCTPATRQITLSLLVNRSAPAPVIIRTSAGLLNWPATLPPRQDLVTEMEINRPATDNGFDWLAFTRGRFSVEVPDAPRLIVPFGTEIARVIEDCRS